MVGTTVDEEILALLTIEIVIILRLADLLIGKALSLSQPVHFHFNVLFPKFQFFSQSAVQRYFLLQGRTLVSGRVLSHLYSANFLFQTLPSH